jgi:predicted RNA methylase
MISNNDDVIDQDELISKLIDDYESLRYYPKKLGIFDSNHCGFPLMSYKTMDTDQLLISSFINAFKRHIIFKNAVVYQVGVGRLALTNTFLNFCRHTYLVESNPALTDFIRAEIEKNDWDKKVTFFVEDALKIKLPEKIDYIVGELMGIWCVNEYQVRIFRHIRQWLKHPDGRLFPEKIKTFV